VLNITWTRLRLTVGSPLASTTHTKARERGKITWKRLRLTVDSPLAPPPVPGPEAVMNITWTRLRLTVGSLLASMTCPRARGCDEYYLDKAEADCRQSTGLHHQSQDQRL
jgi:hypothetical protein